MKPSFIISAILLLAGSIACHAEGMLHRIMPFTTDENVKIDVILEKGAKPLRLDVRIFSDDRKESTLWEGSILDKGCFTSDTVFRARIDGLEPELWSPVNPALYNLEVSCDGQTLRTRVGFRRFEMKDGNFYLNGRKIFLRGNAINPPGRGIPKPLEDSKEFARDYVRFLKGMHVNIIRIPDNQDWMDVCDEEGMMIFGGCYGRPPLGSKKEATSDFEGAMKIYRDSRLGNFSGHPSVVIYTLSNEMPVSGKAGDSYMDFLRRAHKELKTNWDDTREYIGNAGYGLGKAADIYDAHRYWGWYYNTYFTFLNLRDVNMWQNPGRTQAVTFTECVGNYTGIDGRYNLCSRTKQPGSQKCWTGHLSAEEQGPAALKYQASVLKNVTEMFRRLRSQNPYLSGVMPFTIMFFDWDDIHSFAGMKPKPAAYQYGISYQPVLLSWECWNYNVKAGGTLPVRAHIVNDDDYGRDLRGAKLEWRLESPDRHETASGILPVPDIDYYATWQQAIEIKIPENAPTGEYRLQGAVIGSDGKVVSRNSFDVFIASPEWIGKADAKRNIKIYDPLGGSETALKKLGFKVESVKNASGLKSQDILVIGEEGWSGEFGPLETFMQKGGRVLCLRQKPSFDPSWIGEGIEMLDFSNNDPKYMSPKYEYMDGMNINIERRESPIFTGLGRDRMLLWSDYTGFDESKPGFPKIYPVSSGFTAHGVDLTRAVIFANYSRNLSATALIEVRHGKGSAILSGFDLTGRLGTDPVAEKMLVNLVNYAASTEQPEPYIEVGRTIEWGDYTSERGIVTGSVNGLVVNPYPIVPLERRQQYPLKVDERGYHYVAGYGGWADRPGIQYLPRGRRPFAPYAFTVGGNDLVDDENGLSEGEGYFVAKAPEGCTRMLTVFENNSKDKISVEISVNGAQKETVIIPAHSQTVCKSQLPSDGKIKVNFKGDRRTVILRTEFE